MPTANLTFHDFIEATRATGRSKLNPHAPEIEALRARGYSRAQIAEYLAAQGVKVNVNYLSNWMAARDRMTSKQRAIAARDYPRAQMHKESETLAAATSKASPTTSLTPTPGLSDTGRFDSGMSVADLGYAKILEMVPDLAEDERKREEHLRRFEQHRAGRPTP